MRYSRIVNKERAPPLFAMSPQGVMTVKSFLLLLLHIQPR